MNNEQKLKRASELNEEIYPLRLEKMTSSLKHNFHYEKFYKTQNEDSKKIFEEEESKIKLTDQKLLPLLKELKSLQTDYIVEYESLIIENGLSNPKREKLTISIAFYYLVNTKENGFDSADPNQMFLIKQALDFLTNHVASDPTLLNIKTDIKEKLPPTLVLPIVGRK